ncbi:hypothetical protein ACS0TY_027123 [Phlomoides rotata]
MAPHTKEMRLVLSSDAKPRLKWTSNLHHRFIDAVDKLEGAEKATPKSLIRVMAHSWTHFVPPQEPFTEVYAGKECKDIYSKKSKLKGSTYSQCWKKHKKPCQYFANSISRLLLSVDGAHAASCEEMATTMSSAEGAAYKGLQQCIETVMSEIERLLSAEQKATDYRSPDDGITPDHRPTNAYIRVTACNA